MRRLHIVLPMAGRGSRFANAGFVTPKPLIPVDGEPMFLHALRSFDGISADKAHTIVIREEHDKQYGLREQLKRHLPEANIVMTNETPIGATKDALRSSPHLRPDDVVVVMDCDFRFSSQAYNEMAERVLRNELGIAAGLLTFTSTDPRYSFAETDDDGYVIRTAEKQAISNRAIWGAYFFGRADTLMEAGEELLRQPLSEAMKEYYISFLYNLILAKGGKVLAAPVDEYASFGTPEELDAYVGAHVEPC